jgi:hypothetical protein
MTGKRKVILISLGAAIVGILSLSIGLTGLTLQPGDFLPLMGSMPVGNYQGFDMPGGQVLLQFIRVIYLLAIVTIPIVMIYLIISPTARKRLLKFLLRSLPFLLVLYFFILFLKRLSGNNTPDTPMIVGSPANQAAQGQVPPLPPIPNPSETTIVIISVIISVIMVSIIGVALWFLWRRRQPDNSPKQLIARQAQSALDALQAGGDLKNTIIRCYYQMSAVINQQRGIQRSQAMTPHEFEQYLASNGLPGEPVSQLTHLFEEVRYGDLPAGAAEEQVALNSLTAIIEACGGKA